MKKFLLFLMTLMVLAAPQVIRAQSELTVHDGTTTNGFVPLYGFYADAYLKCEMVYPAAELSEMNGGSINSMTFYASQTSVDWGNAEFQVFVAEVSDATISDFAGPGTVVYEGALSIANGMMTVEFDAPYTYNGGNLLVGVYETTIGSYVTSTWYGESVTGASVSGYDYSDLASISATQRDFLPKTTFAYTPAGGVTCEKPDNFTVSNISGYGADFAWTGTVGNYTFEYKKASASDWTVVTGLTANTYTLSNLEPFTVYNTRVKAVCGTDSESGYKTANFTTLDVCPDGMVCIGEGTATNSYLPTYNFYNYSLTQQIYTVDEIGDPAAILGVDIYSVGTVTRNLEIYMVATEKDTFADGNDWIAATTNDLVFSGEVTFAANSWNTMEFDNPFVYNGQSNVALIVRDMTGSYVSGINFFVFDATGQALRAYRDGSEYDIAAPGVTGTVLNVKNRVRFAMGEPPACPKPTGVTVNYTGGTTAEVSWTSDATSFNIDVNGTVTNGVTNPYTLTGLDLSTDYAVMVQADCGAETSEWTNAVEFTTDDCMPEDMIIVNYELADSYGDGWNGNYILVVDENCDIVDALTIESGSTATGTVKVCGTVAQFMWYMSGSNTYPSETSWSFTDANGNELFAGAGNSSMATYDLLYTIDLNPYAMPTDLEAVEVGPHTATLSWTENGTATAWQIGFYDENDSLVDIVDANSNPFTLTGLTPVTEYYVRVRATGANGTSMWPCLGVDFTTDVPCPTPTDLVVNPFVTTADVTWNGFADAYDIEWVEVPATRDPDSDDDGWYYYDNGTYVGSVGLGGGEFQWGVMFPAGSFEGNSLTAVKAFDISAMVGTLAIYNDGETAPADQLSIQDIEFTGDSAWVEFATNVIIDPTKNVWVVFDAVDGAAYPIGTSNDDNGDANGRWVEISGTWYDMANVGVTGRANMIRAHFESSNIDDLTWNTASGVTSPYTIENLTPETTYYVRVKAVCGGEDGESSWKMVQFTTKNACDLPNTLAAETDVTSATLSWNGYQESFNVNYRTAESVIPAFSANFDEGMDGWTTIDADGDGHTWVSSMTPGEYHNASVDLTGNGHNGSAHFVISGSYSNSLSTALTPDNYLVSPQVTFAPTLEFWVEGQDGTYFAEHFGVAVSTAGNTDTTDFTTLTEWTLTEGQTWIKYSVDLSAYAGQTGYFAFRHFGVTDQFILNLDDVVMGTPVPAGDWVTVTSNELTATLSGLEPETEYEWYVEGVNTDCDGELVSETATFTTEELPSQVIALNEGTTWVSFNKEITLSNLKAALVAAAPGATIKISGQNNNTSYNPRTNRWSGTLTWDLSKMYKIYVETACEVTLVGMPIDPADHPVTIVNGNNYLGFPFDQNMTLENAFAGFAVNGDKIYSQTGSATYNRGRWQGSTLTELQPGKGYLYKSAASGSRTFVFPVSAR